ncbi:MAG: amino acid permease [Gammaproteobacteria bacterium]|nr:amino acid permease [Gammaproteobacteria bacterium]
MSGSQATLKGGVGLTGVVMLGAGTAIGVSIFSVLAPAAQVAGSGLLVAVFIAALPMVVFALAYAWLASALPKSGASYEWPRQFIHPLVGFLIAWLRILSNVGAMAVLATVLLDYLNMAIAIPKKPAIAVILTAVFALNYVGVVVAARVQTVLMLLLLVVLGLFVVTGLPQGSAATVGPLLASGWPAVLAAVPLMITLFLGIESAVEIGEEVRDPQRTIPRGIALAIALTAVVYFTVALTAVALLGPDALAASAAPLLDAARGPLGQWALPLIVGAATVSILKSLNATAMVFSRALFAMGRNGALPASLGSIHGRFGTPHVAVLVGYACAMTGLFLPSNLVFLLLAVNIPTMFKYMACSYCAVRIVDRHPEVAGGAALGWSHGKVRAIGYAGVVLGLIIAVLGVEADIRPYLLVAGWAVVGLVYWWAIGRRGS